MMSASLRKLTHTYTHTHTHSHTHTHTHTHMYTHTHTHTCTHTYTHTHTHTHIHTHTHSHSLTHTHTHTHLLLIFFCNFPVFLWCQQNSLVAVPTTGWHGNHRIYVGGKRIVRKVSEAAASLEVSRYERPWYWSEQRNSQCNDHHTGLSLPKSGGSHPEHACTCTTQVLGIH